MALAAMLGASLPAQQDPTTTPGFRLAQAKLAEARGDVAAARRTLEDALAKANDADKAALREALAALPQDGNATTGGDGTIRRPADDPAAAAAGFREIMRQMGRADGPTQDPVQRLIAVLERGPSSVPEVGDASAQLQNLGPLVVPPLLAALPKAGPFGVVHAIDILGNHVDPRIAPAILARANADPAIAQLVIAALNSMTIPVRRDLLAGLDDGQLPPTSLWMLAQSMDDESGFEDKRRALVLRLADEPTVQGEIGLRLVQWQVPWADEVFTKLRASKDPAIAAGATAQWLSQQTNLDEAGALAAIQALDPRHRWWIARQVTSRSKNWAKVALLGLGEGANLKQLQQDPWFLGVDWRSAGGTAASALLQLTKTQPDLVRQLTTPVGAIIRDGWIVPPELDATLASFDLHLFAAALPRDGEARALTAWNRLSREDRWNFTKAIVSLGRPWHRVVAAQIATAENYWQVPEEWLRRDWTGAPAEVGAVLVALAERFPRTKSVVSQATATTNGPAWQWSLIDACQRCQELPSAILLPYVRAGDQFAWDVLAKRDPSAALAIARAPDGPWQNVTARVLGEHGTAEDVATLMRRMGWSALSEQELDQVRPFVLRHGLGNLALLSRMANAKDHRAPLSDPRSQVPAVALDLAKQIAARIDIAQLPECLTILPKLPREVAEHAIQTLQSQVGTSHAPMLAQALADATAREPIVPAEVVCLLDLMTRSGSTECLPALRSALTNARLGGYRSQIAATMVSLPGQQWPAMLRELLAHPDARVVAEALAAIKPGQDQELLAAVTKALLANLRTLGAVDTFFDGLEPASRADTASAVLQAPDFPQSADELARSTLRALGSLKDRRFAADLARGAQHRNASVRATAAEQLGRLFTRDAAPFLLELLKDDDKAVRMLAKERLELLADYLDGEAKWNERLHRK